MGLYRQAALGQWSALGPAALPACALKSSGDQLAWATSSVSRCCWVSRAVLPSASTTHPPAPPCPCLLLCCSGLGPSLLGVMHVVIQFPLYESLKARFAARHADGGPNSEKLNL